VSLAEVNPDATVGERDSAQSAPGPDADRRLRALDLFRLDSTAATVTFWTSLALITVSVLVPRILPCVDYPQHLALSEIIRRLGDASAPEHARYSVNVFTYNGLFHLICAALGRFVTIELAGRMLVALSIALLGTSALALVNITRRPPIYALAFLPLLFSFSLNWGFINYALSVAIGTTALAVMARSAARPTMGLGVATAALGLICAGTHVLGMLVLCLFGAALVPEIAWRACKVAGQATGLHLWRVLVRATVALSPLLFGCAYCIAVHFQQYSWNPTVYQDATMEGHGPPIWNKLLYFSSYASGLHRDGTDQFLLLASIAVLLGAWGLEWRRRRRLKHSPASGELEDPEGDGIRPIVLPAVVLLVAYLLTPMVFVGTHLIFPRLAQGVLLGAILAAPRFPPRFAGYARTTLCALGACVGLNFFAHSVLYALETDDFSRVIDESPAGRRATAVVYGTDTFSFRQETLVHFAGYYAARREGDWAFSFARFLSVPVRFKAGGSPPWPLLGWEFTPTDYNPRCGYARVFDLVFVRAPRFLPSGEESEAEPLVRKLVFGEDAARVKLVSHHGRFWAFDSADIPHDGTL
jgi:hypothetical protein